MTQPTKADLAAAVTRLTEQSARLTGENAGLRDLLAAVSAYADVPHPASHDDRAYAYAYELERRLDAIAIYASGGRKGMDPGVYVLVIQDRAKHLREEAARPVRYEVRAEPAPAAPAEVLAASIKSGAPVVTANPPYHMTGNMIGPSCGTWDGNFICNAQAGHDGPDHVAYDGKDHECHRWPVAAAPAEHPFDAGEGSRELSGPGRELLATAIAEQDAAEDAASVTA